MRKWSCTFTFFHDNSLFFHDNPPAALSFAWMLSMCAECGGHSLGWLLFSILLCRRWAKVCVLSVCDIWLAYTYYVAISLSSAKRRSFKSGITTRLYLKYTWDRLNKAEEKHRYEAAWDFFFPLLLLASCGKKKVNQHTQCMWILRGIKRSIQQLQYWVVLN